MHALEKADNDPNSTKAKIDKVYNIYIIIYIHDAFCGIYTWVCCVALPCCLFDLACFFLPSFSSLIKTCIYMYMYM